MNYDIQPEWTATFRKGRYTRIVRFGAENQQSANTHANRMAYKNEQIVSVEMTREGRNLNRRRM